MQKILVVWLVSLFFVPLLRAQDSVLSFSVSAKGNGKVVIGWHSPYRQATQISIQRSMDSLKNFTTLLTVPDPKLPQNGAVDSKSPSPGAFYRLFIVLNNGKYFFTPSRRPEEPGIAAARAMTEQAAKRVQYTQGTDGATPSTMPPSATTGSGIPAPHATAPAPIPEKILIIKKRDSVIGQLPASRSHQFRDSLLIRTKDTLVYLGKDTLLIKPFGPATPFRASSRVFTSRFGNVQLALPDVAKKHYSVKFFEENNKPLFELSAIKDSTLILDKTNFRHAGWFRYELYENGQLKENSKLFIPKEF